MVMAGDGSPSCPHCRGIPTQCHNFSPFKNRKSIVVRDQMLHSNCFLSKLLQSIEDEDYVLLLTALEESYMHSFSPH